MLALLLLMPFPTGLQAADISAEAWRLTQKCAYESVAASRQRGDLSRLGDLVLLLEPDRLHVFAPEAAVAVKLPPRTRDFWRLRLEAKDYRLDWQTREARPWREATPMGAPEVEVKGEVRGTARDQASFAKLTGLLARPGWGAGVKVCDAAIKAATAKVEMSAKATAKRVQRGGTFSVAVTLRNDTKEAVEISRDGCAPFVTLVGRGLKLNLPAKCPKRGAVTQKVAPGATVSETLSVKAEDGAERGAVRGELSVTGSARHSTGFQVEIE